VGEEWRELRGEELLMRVGLGVLARGEPVVAGTGLVGLETLAREMEEGVGLFWVVVGDGILADGNCATASSISAREHMGQSASMLCDG
jgi:hypothetical protein